MFFPLLCCTRPTSAGGMGFGDAELSAPQAGLMAALAQGIVGGEMAWPLVIVGILMGLGFVLLKVRSPMLVSVGMYLPPKPPSQFSVAALSAGCPTRSRHDAN